MKFKNEQPIEPHVKYDVDLTDAERAMLLKYGKDNISDDELVEFALVDIITKQVNRFRNKDAVDTILTFCENAALLGCPRSVDVDMWFRELNPNERADVVMKLKEIQEES